MPRRVVAVMVLWAAVVAIWAIFVEGGTVYMCLGGLGVTEDSCRAANGMPPVSDWERLMRSPIPIMVLLGGGWASILGIARWKRQRGGL